MNITSSNSSYNIGGLKIDQLTNSVIVNGEQFFYPDDISNTDIRINDDKIFIGNYQLDYKNNQWVKNDFSSIFKRNFNNPTLTLYNNFIMLMVLLLIIYLILGIALT
jgi:hypothetical protein